MLWVADSILVVCILSFFLVMSPVSLQPTVVAASWSWFYGPQSRRITVGQAHLNFILKPVGSTGESSSHFWEQTHPLNQESDLSSGSLLPNKLNVQHSSDPRKQQLPPLDDFISTSTLCPDGGLPLCEEESGRWNAQGTQSRSPTACWICEAWSLVVLTASSYSTPRSVVQGATITHSGHSKAN